MDDKGSRGPLTRVGVSDALSGVVTRSVLDAQAVSDRALRLANALQQQALDLIEQKGADMTVAEAQRVLRLFLLRSLLVSSSDTRELAAVGKEIDQMFPPVKTSDGELKVTV